MSNTDQLIDTTQSSFLDRRDASKISPPGLERRQFVNNHACLSPAACELATAIDDYKVRHRRRFITYEEMLSLVKELGYKRQ